MLEFELTYEEEKAALFFYQEWARAYRRGKGDLIRQSTGENQVYF